MMVMKMIVFLVLKHYFFWFLIVDVDWNWEEYYAKQGGMGDEVEEGSNRAELFDKYFRLKWESNNDDDDETLWFYLHSVGELCSVKFDIGKSAGEDWYAYGTKVLNFVI